MGTKRVNFGGQVVKDQGHMRPVLTISVKSVHSVLIQLLQYTVWIKQNLSPLPPGEVSDIFSRWLTIKQNFTHLLYVHSYAKKIKKNYLIINLIN